MGRQLTPEERRIIRDTKRAGAEMEAENQSGKPNKYRSVINTIIYIVAFIVFVIVGRLIVSTLN